MGKKFWEVSDALLLGVVPGISKQPTKVFEVQCESRHLWAVERMCWLFNYQLAEERIGTYITELKALSSAYDFRDIKEYLMKDSNLWDTLFLLAGEICWDKQSTPGKSLSYWTVQEKDQ